MSKKYQKLYLFIFSAFVLATLLPLPVFAESAGQYIDDATITAKVKEAILRDSQLSVMQVKVDTGGTVILSGLVDSHAEELEAVKIAHAVKGVAEVTDNMGIRVMRED